MLTEWGRYCVSRIQKMNEESVPTPPYSILLVTPLYSRLNFKGCVYIFSYKKTYDQDE